MFGVRPGFEMAGADHVVDQRQRDRMSLSPRFALSDGQTRFQDLPHSVFDWSRAIVERRKGEIILRKSLFVCVSFFAAWAVSIPCNLSAEETQAAWGPKSTPDLVAVPQRLVEVSGVEPAFVLAAADEAMVRPISAWNLAGNFPLRNGFERSLPKALLVVLPKKEPGTKLEHFGGGVLARSADDDAVVWGLALRVEQAWRMRIRLGDVRLPKDAQMWVYGENGETVGPFGAELLGPDGTLWTPSVGGPEIRLEISVPDTAWETGDAPSLKVIGVSELFPLGDAG